MKIAILTTFGSYGGASTCAKRLATALAKQGNEVSYLYLAASKTSFGESVFQKPLRRVWTLAKFIFERWRVSRNTSERAYVFKYSIGDTGSDLRGNKHIQQADVLHLHWVSFSFISIAQIRQLSDLKPVFWTLHDMWAFTGGCHYAFDCTHYADTCGDCYYLKRTSSRSARTLTYKQNTWEGASFQVLTTSQWMADCAKRSTLFKRRNIEVLATPIDIEVFSPVMVQRKESDRLILLFGAVDVEDHRKGFHLFQQAVQCLVSEKFLVEVCVFGTNGNDSIANLDCPVTFLGHIQEEKELALAYSRADIFILPSLQDNLPNTVMESLSCATPVVTFDSGGVVDMVKHQQTGYVAKLGNYEDLAEGIKYFSDRQVLKKASEAARTHIVDNFSEKVIAQKQIQLYKSVLEK